MSYDVGKAMRKLLADQALMGAHAPSSSTSALAGVVHPGGSNGGAVAHPLPAACCRETTRVACEDTESTAPSVRGRASKRSQQSGGSVQIRLRVPADFAEVLLAMPPGYRGLALWLALEGRIGDVWDLGALIKGAGEVRRVGVLLNQSLRYLSSGRGELAELADAVADALRAIKMLRPPTAGGGGQL